MAEVKVGDRVRDNDPREVNRVMVVLKIEGSKATLRHPSLPSKTHWTRVSVARIHTDGKSRRSGWSLVTTPAVEPGSEGS